MLAIITGIAILFALSILGFLLAQAISPQLTSWEKTAIAFPLGSGIYTWFLFLSNWVGLSITTFNILILYGLLASTLLIIILFRAYGNNRTLYGPHDVARDPMSKIPKDEILFYTSIFILILIAYLISLGRSYGDAYDALAIWAVKGYAIMHQGSISAAEQWGWWGLSYPLNIMLQIGMFFAFGAENLPASKLLFPTYLLSLTIFSYFYLRKHGGNRAIISLAILFILTNPVVFDQSVKGYANLPFASLIAISTLIGIETGFRKNKGMNFIVALLLGIIAWTRPEGLAYAITILIGFTIASSIYKDVRYFPAYLLPPAIVIPGSWLLFARNDVMEARFGEVAGSFFSRIFAGDVDFYELYYIPRLFLERAISPDNWGTFIPTIILLALGAIILKNNWRSPKTVSLLILTSLVTILPYGIYFIVSLNPFEDFELILRRDFDRAFLPAFILISLSLTSICANTGAGHTDPSNQ